MTTLPLRIGFVPLTDAAPLAVALDRRFFADEGLRVTLERQNGWGNVRDKLTFGHLQAAHAVVGMPLASGLGRQRYAEPLVALMNLGVGADAVTFGRRLTDAGVTTVAAWVRGGGAVPVLAHVFGCSVHHYLPRAWLAGGGWTLTATCSCAYCPRRRSPASWARATWTGTAAASRTTHWPPPTGTAGWWP